MKTPIVIIGIGELGGEFARGFLRCGYPVYPITRQVNMAELSVQIPQPALVLITVPEDELSSLLQSLPAPWRDKVGLLQNELLPRDWQQHNIKNPTVAVVWFEKKPEKPLANILDTPVFGPNTQLVVQALAAINIPTRCLKNEQALLFELVRKSVYILTVNISGLVYPVSVGSLWQQHQSLAREVAREVISIQEWLTGVQLPVDKLINGMLAGIEDCPQRNCLGRSAVKRLQRTLAYAAEAGIETPKLTEISRTLRSS